uniref:Uncharacterized protein n=1 Tax=Rhizophora mucronata TaxID=61149 RepID=A0A2P2J7W3_RHIMU
MLYKIYFMNYLGDLTYRKEP